MAEEIKQEMEKSGEEVSKKVPNSEKGLFDRGLTKLVSRKLWVWGWATGLLLAGVLTPDWWAYISLVYIGSEAAATIVATAKGGMK